MPRASARAASGKTKDIETQGVNNNASGPVVPATDDDQLEGVGAYDPEFLAKYGLTPELLKEAEKKIAPVRKGRSSNWSSDQRGVTIFTHLEGILADFSKELENTPEGDELPEFDPYQCPRLFYGKNAEFTSFKSYVASWVKEHSTDDYTVSFRYNTHASSPTKPSTASMDGDKVVIIILTMHIEYKEVPAEVPASE